MRSFRKVLKTTLCWNLVEPGWYPSEVNNPSICFRSVKNNFGAVLAIWTPTTIVRAPPPASSVVPMAGASHASPWWCVVLPVLLMLRRSISWTPRYGILSSALFLEGFTACSVISEKWALRPISLCSSNAPYCEPWSLRPWQRFQIRTMGMVRSKFSFLPAAFSARLIPPPVKKRLGRNARSPLGEKSLRVTLRHFHISVSPVSLPSELPFLKATVTLRSGNGSWRARLLYIRRGLESDHSQFPRRGPDQRQVDWLPLSLPLSGMRFLAAWRWMDVFTFIGRERDLMVVPLSSGLGSSGIHWPLFLLATKVSQMFLPPVQQALPSSSYRDVLRTSFRLRWAWLENSSGNTAYSTRKSGATCTCILPSRSVTICSTIFLTSSSLVT